MIDLKFLQKIFLREYYNISSLGILVDIESHT